MTLRSVEVQAFAKVNVTLTVLGRRPDGYHEIDTLFATVGIHDTITVTAADSALVTGSTIVEGDAVGEIAPPMDHGNLAWRAAQAWRAVDVGAPGLRVDLIKRLPVAAGLGGGSSDAAATLRAIAALRPGTADPMDLAASLGSDVPFFAAGWPAAWGAGRGDVLEGVSLSPRPVVLVNFGEAVPVRMAYEAWARGDGAGTGADFSRRSDVPLHEGRRADLRSWRAQVVRAWNDGDDLPGGNDLETGIVARYPGVAASLTALREAGLTGVRMSGSGATCFGLAGDADHARRAVATIERRHPRAWVAWSFAPATP